MQITSPFTEYYLNIIRRLVAAAPNLRYIAQDLGQMENYPEGGEPPVAFPAALIDLNEAQFEDMSDFAQISECIMQIRICQPAYAGTVNSLTPGWVQQRALEYLETEQQVFLAIHGWSAENASKHVRVSFKTEVRGDQYRVRQLRFRFGLEDYSAKPTRTSIARPEPTIYFDPITRYLLDEMGRPILTDEGFVITT